MPNQSFSNPFQATRKDIGVGLENIMKAMYASKANEGGASRRSAAQDVKDTADAYKAQAEGDQIRRVESGVQDFVPNFAKSLVPENEVPNVMARNQTGIWPAFEDPRRQQSVVEGQGPVDWSPEKDLALNDAKRNAAYLGATKEANFKDLAASMEGAASDRSYQNDLLPPNIGLPSRVAVPADATKYVAPQMGLPSGPGMISAMPVQSTDENGVTTKPMSDGGSVSPIALSPSDIAMPPPVQSPAPPAAAAPAADMALPILPVDAKSRTNTDELLRRAQVAATHGRHQDATAFTGIANAARGQQEADFRELDKNKLHSIPGTGAFHDDQGNVYDANKSRILTGDQVREFQNKQAQSASTKIDVHNSEQAGTLRMKQAAEMEGRAIKARQYASVISSAADALEGYGGGWTAETQAKIGHLFPDSEYGKIASIDDVAKSIVNKNYNLARDAGTGQTSDFEAKGFIAAFPTLAATPNGRQFIKLFGQRMADREMAAASIYGEMADTGKRVDLREWSKRVDAAAPLFSSDEWKQIRELQAGGIGTAPPTGNSTLTPEQRKQYEAEARRKGLAK